MSSNFAKQVWLIACLLVLTLTARAQSPVYGIPSSSSNVPTPTIFGQSVDSNGTALQASWGTLALQAPGVINIGDSITCGFGLANYTADGATSGAYAWLLGGILGGTQNNYCKSGWTVTDSLVTKVIPNLKPGPTLQPATTIMLGTNDNTQFGSGAGAIANYKAEMSAMVAWATIPQQQKVIANTCTSSGTWTTNTTIAGVTGEKTITAGDTLTCTITTAGKPLFVVNRVIDANAGGTGTITIDGVAQGTLASAPTSGQTITTANMNQTEFLTQYNVASGTHTVVFTSTVTGGGIFDVDWLGTPPAQGLVSPPRVFLAGPPPQGSTATTAAQNGMTAYQQAAQSVVTTLAAAGLPVAYVPVENYVNTGNDYLTTTATCDDGTTGAGSSSVPLHPNYCGQKHILAAFNSVIKPITVPAVPAQSSTFTSPVVTNVTPADLSAYSNVNGLSNANPTSLDAGICLYCVGTQGFGIDLGSVNGTFATRLFAPNNINGQIANCFHTVPASATPNTQAILSAVCPFILNATKATATMSFPIQTGSASNNDMVGELALSAATTASYTFTVTTHSSHPECFVQPQFNAGSNTPWVTYTGVASFTVNFGTAVTGAVSYQCMGRN